MKVIWKIPIPGLSSRKQLPRRKKGWVTTSFVLIIMVVWCVGGFFFQFLTLYVQKWLWFMVCDLRFDKSKSFLQLETLSLVFNNWIGFFSEFCSTSSSKPGRSGLCRKLLRKNSMGVHSSGQENGLPTRNLSSQTQINFTNPKRAYALLKTTTKKFSDSVLAKRGSEMSLLALRFWPNVWHMSKEFGEWIPMPVQMERDLCSII